MDKPKSSGLLKILSIALTLELAIVIGLPTRTQAQTAQTPNIPKVLIAGVTFDPPADGKPDDSAGGASRDGGMCPEDVKNPESAGLPVTSLIPPTNQGLTVAAHPTLFVYVPETSAKEIFVSLEDENSQQQYQTSMPLTGKAGVVSVTLPDSAPALEVGKTYKWSFVIKCGNVIRPDSPRVEGQIKRVEPNLASNQLEQGTYLERAALYGKNGIWYDTIANLAAARRAQPNDPKLATSWSDLLKSVGLNAIAAQPLLK